MSVKNGVHAGVLAQYGYRMSKAALNCAGATLARDLKDDAISVALIHPGAVRSCHLFTKAMQR